MLLDIDRLNDGVAPANGAVDFSMLLSGQLTPTFEVKTGDGDDDVLEFDLSDVFSVDADLYMVSFIFSVMEFILIIMSQQMLTFVLLHIVRGRKHYKMVQLAGKCAQFV